MKQEEKTFSTGDKCYLPDGTECVFVEKCSAGNVVQRVIVCEDREDITDPEIVTSRLFAEEPVEKIGEKIASAKAELAALSKDLQEAGRNRDSSKAELDKLMSDLSVVPTLRRLSDIIAGKVTHYTISYWSGISIVTAEEAHRNEDYPKDLKLLSLFGRSGGDMSWRINAYYDGSGSWTTCVPCMSYEEAQVEAQKILDAKLAKNTDMPTDADIESAKKFGLTIRPDKIEQRRQLNRKHASAAVDAAQKALDEKKAALAALV